MTEIRTEKWLLTQASTLGSTAAGIVAGQSPYQTASELFDTVTAARAGRIIPKPLTHDMRRGLRLEPLHRELLEEETRQPLIDHDQDEFMFHKAYPWAHALPDGWMEYEGEIIPVQLKCPRSRNWLELKLKGVHGHWLLGSQHSIAVCEVPVEYFSILNPETLQLIHFPIYRDQALIDELMRMERAFWALLDAGTPPPVDAQPEIELPPVNGELVRIDSIEAREAVEAYREAVELSKAAEELKQYAANSIKQLMGEAQVADLPGLRVYHRQQAGAKRLDLKAVKRAGIDLSPYYHQSAPFRTFRTYPLKNHE